MAAVVTTTTLSAWRARRIPSPDRSSVRHHGRAGERPSTSHSADTSHLDSGAAFDPTQGGVYRRYFSRFHPPLPPICSPAFTFAAAHFPRSQAAAGGRGAPRDFPGVSGRGWGLHRPRDRGNPACGFFSGASGGLDLCRDGLMLMMERSSADPRRSAEAAGGLSRAGEQPIGVAEKPGGKKPSGVVVMLGVRALLVAVLLIGSTGSIRCQVICAEFANSQATAHARPAEMATPDHGGCHGRGIASPEPLSERSGESCEKGCCTVLTHATVTPNPISGPASAASPMLACVDLGEVRTKSSDFLHKSRPAERLNSPFHFRNPPLLI